MDNLRCLSVQVPGDYSYVIKRTEAAEFEIRFIELSKDHLENYHRYPYMPVMSVDQGVAVYHSRSFTPIRLFFRGDGRVRV